MKPYNMAITTEQVLDALRHVEEPESGRDLGDGLKLAEELGMVLRQVAHDPSIPEQLADVALDHGQVQMVL